jgi:hypothetical protein
MEQAEPGSDATQTHDLSAYVLIEEVASQWQAPSRISRFSRTGRRLTLAFCLGLAVLIVWEVEELLPFLHATVFF